MTTTTRPRATAVREGERRCPTCGVVEARWTVGNVEYVNLSPLDGRCVRCLGTAAPAAAARRRPRVMGA